MSSMSEEYPKVIASKQLNAATVLSDGLFFFGNGIGKKGKVTGEVCFNTSLTGYQEIITDPSYQGQIINFTFPHIGNVGANKHDVESADKYANGIIIRENISSPANFRSEIDFNYWLVQHNITGISNVDSRALTKHIRKNGAKMAIIQHAEIGEEIDIAALYAQVKILADLHNQDLASKIGTKQSYQWQHKIFDFTEQNYPTNQQAKHHIVAIDYGVKENILRCLVQEDCRVTIVSPTLPAAEIIALQPDGIFLTRPFPGAFFYAT